MCINIDFPSDSVQSEERGRAPSLPNTPILRPAGSSPCVLPDINTEQSQHIIYKGHYDAGRYTRLTDDDLWTQLDHQCFGGFSTLWLIFKNVNLKIH